MGLLLASRLWPSSAPRPPENLAEGEYHVSRVIDGDTLLLSNHARVRLMGVNTPETVKPNHAIEPWGLEAKQFTEQFIAAAAGRVNLRFDRERVDRYGRFLAYVWIGDQMLNEELLRAGLARFEPAFYYSGSIKLRYRKAQDEARAARRGIWSRP
ncbi:MAG TPA: thermonuclease family protein [Pirellulales bacterium]|nr:thermonuclease family protein [Pirellulales bacterium]